MPRRFWGIVLLVSLAHALVHTYELVFPAIEQVLAEAWRLDTTVTGRIATLWALPFGVGALGAGWLADRFGSRRVLIVYLVGCSAACLAVAWAGSLIVLQVAMFGMGAFASLYHPAGLSYISRLVPSERLGEALGYHGILGAMGVAGAPFLVGLSLVVLPWNGAYLLLAPVGLILAVVVATLLPDDSTHRSAARVSGSHGDWAAFAVFCLVAVLLGMTYRGFLTFLPRYLNDVQLPWLAGLSARSVRSYLAGGVLVMGIVGQYSGGWLCGRYRLEALLLVILTLNIPALLWLGVASDNTRLLATGSFAIIHFAVQPVGNSLIARYTPSHRRSLGYGINFLASFGCGSFGAMLAGEIAHRKGITAIYPALALVTTLATVIAAYLWARARRGERLTSV